MKTGKVAKVFGIDRKTVSNWTDMPQFHKFFSSEAHSINRTQREYLEPDLLVINTIRAMRDKGMDWDEIAIFLETGERERELPPSALLVETMAPIAQYGRLVELQTALDKANEQNEILQDDLEHLRAELQEHRDKAQQQLQEYRDKVQQELQQRVDEVRNQERETAKSERSELQTTINELYRLIGKLEAQIEVLKGNQSEE